MMKVRHKWLQQTIKDYQYRGNEWSIEWWITRNGSKYEVGMDIIRCSNVQGSSEKEYAS